jgi:hypothetical protein
MTAAVTVSQGLSNSWVVNTLMNFDNYQYQMFAYATDSSGNVFQLSGYYQDATYAYQTSFAVSKVRVDGSIAWQVVLAKSPTPTSSQYLNYIATLPNGDVAITGWEFIDSPQSIPIIILSGATGSVITQKRIRWSDASSNTKGPTRGLHIDSSGNYYIVQQSQGLWNCYVTKLNSSFAVQWQIGQTSTNDDFGNGASTNYVVSNFAGNSSGTTVTVQNFDNFFVSPRKFHSYVTVVNSSGTILWKKWFNYGYVISVDIDSNGNVYCLSKQWTTTSVVGKYWATWNSTPYYDYIIFKMDTSGNILWTKTMPAPANVYNGSNYLQNPYNVIATTDSVYVTTGQSRMDVVNGGVLSDNGGDSGASQSGNYVDALVIHKINSSDGSLAWRNKSKLSVITSGQSPYGTIIDIGSYTNPPVNMKNILSGLDGQRKIIGMIYSAGSRVASLFFKIPDNNAKTFSNLSIGNNTYLSFTQETGMSYSTYNWPSGYVYMGTSGASFSNTPFTSTVSVTDYASGYWATGAASVYVTNLKTNIP